MFTININFLVGAALRRQLIHKVDERRFREYLAAGKVAFFTGEEIGQAVRDGMITIAKADDLLWFLGRTGIAWYDPKFSDKGA